MSYGESCRTLLTNLLYVCSPVVAIVATVTSRVLRLRSDALRRQAKDATSTLRRIQQKPPGEPDTPPGT
jgi:hypothetical protein